MILSCGRSSDFLELPPFTIESRVRFADATLQVYQNATILYQNATGTGTSPWLRANSCGAQPKHLLKSRQKFDSQVYLKDAATCLLERPSAKSGGAKLIRSRRIHALGVVRNCWRKCRSSVRTSSPTCTAKAFTQNLCCLIATRSSSVIKRGALTIVSFETGW